MVCSSQRWISKKDRYLLKCIKKETLKRVALLSMMSYVMRRIRSLRIIPLNHQRSHFIILNTGQSHYLEAQTSMLMIKEAITAFCNSSLQGFWSNHFVFSFFRLMYSVFLAEIHTFDVPEIDIRFASSNRKIKPKRYIAIIGFRKASNPGLLLACNNMFHYHQNLFHNSLNLYLFVMKLQLFEKDIYQKRIIS